MHGHLTTRGYVIAVAAHAAAAAALAFAPAPYPAPRPAPHAVRLRLEAPPEQFQPQYLVASLPRRVSELPDKPYALPVASPTPRPPESPAPTPPPPPTPTPPPQNTPPPLDREAADELEKEREELKKRLEDERRTASTALDRIAKSGGIGSAVSPQVAAGPVGTIRELDMSGWPKEVVETVMAKYNLRVSHRMVGAGSNQSFLSAAANSQGDRFYADRNSKAGVYEVFELSRKAIARMSQLEEEEIRKRRLDLERTQVREVRFGIVRAGEGHDLGVLELKAQAVP